MKKKISLYKILIGISILFISLNVKAQIDPGVDFDLNGFINDKLDAGETNIVVPPGRYRVPEFNSTHLYFSGRNDVTIIADGVEMICTETVQAIQIENCHNFKLQGISIDYDPLPFTQGEIVELSSNKRTLIVDLIDGYSSAVMGDKLEVYDSITGELVTITYYGVTYTVDEENRRVTITKPSNYGLSTSQEEVGDIVVLGSKSSKRIPHSIVPRACTNLVLENVTLYAGTTFGFFETNSSGSQYINCKVDRRPLATDIKERGVRRMRSNNADGFHSKHAKVGPSYIGCVSRYNGDDGIAINGNYHVVTASVGSRLSVVGKGAKVPNLSAGDDVELVSYIGNRLPNAKIVSIEVGPALTTEERSFLQSRTFYAEAADSYKASNVYYVTLDRAVYLPLGSVIASANHVGNNFEVRDCIIGPNRSRGILVKASNGNITGNTLTDNWGEAIKIAPEYVWLEAGSGSNITISDNTVSGCHDASIAVYAYGGNGSIAPIGAHDNIQITGNLISGSTNPAIAVTSTSNLAIENNVIETPNNDLLLPWIMGNFGRNEDADREIYINNFEFISVTDVTIDNCPDADLNIDDTYDLNRTVSPSNAMDQSTSWSSDDESIATVDPRGIVTALAPGVVAITVTANESGVESLCSINVLEEPVLSTNIDKKAWSIYPNPADDFIWIEGPNIEQTIVRIILFDLSGQKIIENVINPDQGQCKIDVQGLARGIHLVEIHTGGQIIRQKIIIK